MPSGNKFLLLESFDHYATADAATKATQIIAPSSSGTLTIAAVGRRGTNGLKLHGQTSTNSASGRRRWALPASGAGFCFGYAFQCGFPFGNLLAGTTEGGQTSNVLGSIWYLGASQVWFRLNTGGTVSALRGTTVLGTSTAALVQGVYHYLQFMGVIDPSAGTIDVWLDGVNILHLTGQNTRGGSASAWDEYVEPDNVTSNTSSGGDWSMDDEYVMDLSGYATTLNGAIDSSQTTVTVVDASQLPAGGGGAFRVMVDQEIMRVTAVSGNDLTVQRGFDLSTAASHLTAATVTAKCPQGDVRIDYYAPTSDGSHSSGTLSTGTDHFAVVDEAAANGDTDYVTLSAAGDRESLNFPNLSVAGADVLGIQIVHQVKKTDAGAAGIKGSTRISGTDYDGAEQGVPSSYKFLRTMMSERPSDGAPWLDTDFNAAEFGEVKST